MNTKGSSFLSLVEHIQAFTGEFCFASELFFENIKATVCYCLESNYTSS